MRTPTSLLLSAALLFAGCETAPPVHSMRDSSANFSAFHTFAWKDSQNAAAISLLDTDIRKAITSELERKGYAEIAPGLPPDLVLTYETDAAEKAKANNVRVGVGVGGGGPYGGVGMGVSSPSHKIVREGTLVLSVVDPHRNAEVWNGRVSREVAQGGRPSVSMIKSAVAELMQDFPSRTVP